MYDYDGQTDQNWDFDNYQVETFPVNMPIKKGWRLAMRSTDTSAIRRSSGGTMTLLHNPPLSSGWGWQNASGDDGCWTLIEGAGCCATPTASPSTPGGVLARTGL